MWTVVIVDDYPVVRQVFKEFFQCFSDSFKVVGEASNGQEGVRVVKDKNPDFVLMDITMPLLDGIEATKIIKREMGYSSMIITYTGYPKSGLGEKAKEAGAREHLVKPLNLMAVKKMMEEYGEKSLLKNIQIG